jgi:lysozyme
MSIRKMLEFEEGREHKAYPDPISRGEPWTIGIGHTGPDVRGGTVWDDAQIDLAFGEDILIASGHCQRQFPWFDALNEPRQAVLVSMAFQMGVTRLLKFANTLAAIREGRYDDAAAGMRASVWARQTPHRAIRLADQMATGEWDPNYVEH